MASGESRIERWTGKPRVVEMMLWDGSTATLEAIREWIGPLPEGDAGFRAYPAGAEVWNTEEHCWVNCPVGHRVAKGRLGEFYPISPAAVDAGYVRTDGE